ncbi:MAG: preQ(1) synthase [Candidatus Latescibacteria bacterium]|nr:preQ(1) synthase [Candidatus Latescibacterota bacterium]
MSSAALLEAFDNPNPERPYTIEFTFSEFTSLCPKTGQPDFATIIIRYIPGPRCVELRSLKHYFWSFRNEGIYMEPVTNQILNDLVALCEPVEMTVVSQFNIRGAVDHEITASYTRE